MPIDANAEPLLPSLVAPVPGPRSTEQVDVLAQRECPAITARRSRRAATLGVADTDPIVWKQARGANVWDVDGNRYVDLTSGFGVALVGHRNTHVVAAAHHQLDTLLHAMGDAYPDTTRIRLLDRLVGLAPQGIEHAILGLSGSDAIDAMVKTALLATGRTGVLVFEGAYHGLSLGAVPLQRYKHSFSDPFSAITHPDVHALPYGCTAETLEAHLSGGRIGLVLVEPIQGRGGMRPPPAGWLEELAEIARRHGALFGVDEIQTGLGRTGTTWATPFPPDLMAVGKALGGGFPISACMGTKRAMKSWGASEGEALHTQTFLGHPVGCAAANAVIDLLPQVETTVRSTSAWLCEALGERGWQVRGRGLMLGVLHPDAVCAYRAMLQQGWIVLPAGMQAEVLGLTPPAVIDRQQLEPWLQVLEASR